MAPAEGLLARVGAKGEGVQLSPGMARSTMDLYATMFLFLAAGARAALTEFGVQPA